MLANNEFNEDKYIVTNHKRLKHKNNRSFVTARVNIVNNKKAINISIGLDVCDLVEFYRHDRLQLYINKSDRNLLMIKKDYDGDSTGYLLSYDERPKTSFMTFQFRYECPEEFRLSQTIILDYDFDEPGMIVLNLEKLKWSR